jgi:hypothetical protein
VAVADRTVRAIFEARVTGAQKGMRDLSTDVDKTGKKVGGLSKDLKDLDKVKVKPQIDLDIDQVEREIADLKAEIDRLDAMEATPEVLLDFSRAQVQLGAAESALKELNGRKAEMQVTADTSQAEDALDDLGTAGDDAGEGIVSGILDALKSIPIAGAVVGVGAAIGAGLLLGLQQGLAVEAERDVFSAQTGLDEETSARFGRAAGEAYANAWGDSVAQNLDTARLALRAGLIDESATDAEIENVIAKLSGISDLFDYDITESVRAVGNLMKTGLVRDANQAFDLIVKSSQQVQSDDLIDTVNEYSNQFVNLGLRAEEAFGLIVQGVEAGARDTDNVADALKEMGLRIREGTEPAVDALKGLGLNAKEIVTAFREGGPQARAAMDLIFDKLREVESETGNTQDAITNLFGGPGEDLGAALFALDIQTAIDALDGVEGSAGAADRALATMSDNTAAQMESAKRNVQLAAEGIQGALAEAFGDDIEGVAEWVQRNRAPLLEFFLGVINGTIDMAEAFVEFSAGALDSIGELADGLADFIDSIPFVDDALAESLRNVADGARGGAAAIRADIPDALDEVRDKANAWAAPEILKARIHDATVAMTQDLDELVEQVGDQDLSVKINGDTVNAEEALAVLVDNINEEDGTVTINGDRVPAEDALDVLMRAIETSEEDVQIGADTRPGRGDLRRFQGQISAADASMTVNADTAAAEREIDRLARDRYATLRIRVAGVNSPGGQVAGPHDGGWTPMGALPGLYSGGFVPGGDPGYDNILWPLNTGGRTLMQPLAGGEFVMNSKDSAYWGPVLELMNKGIRPTTHTEHTEAPVYIGTVTGPDLDTVLRKADETARTRRLARGRR